jgi:hypothetical protein
LKERVETYLIRYVVFGDEPKLPQIRLLITLTDIMLKDVIKSVRGGTCPFCNGKFKKIYNHLVYSASPCSRTFTLSITHVYMIYSKLMKYVMWRKGELILDLPNTERLYFKNKEELINYLREHEEILKQLETEPLYETKTTLKHLT